MKPSRRGFLKGILSTAAVVPAVPVLKTEVPAPPPAPAPVSALAPSCSGYSPQTDCRLLIDGREMPAVELKINFFRSAVEKPRPVFRAPKDIPTRTFVPGKRHGDVFARIANKDGVHQFLFDRFRSGSDLKVKVLAGNHVSRTSPVYSFNAFIASLVVTNGIIPLNEYMDITLDLTSGLREAPSRRSSNVRRRKKGNQ